jgi:predicted glutamine amidotransferase
MCGLFGWVGRDPRSFNKTKLDLLGIMNETRGKDSCGLSVDSEIYVGVDKEKLYRDWLSTVNYNVPQEVPIVLGHTRAATGGAHTVDNAHPFGFGVNNKQYDFIGVHNGTLLNDMSLAVARGIDQQFKKVKDNITTYRTKIDSEILLECLYKDNNFTVLSDYNGAAALLWYETKKPNVLYAYHGASSLTKHEDKIYIERPLFFYKESKYSLYISSLEESLVAIGGTDKTVFEFETNKVYKITNGDIDSALKFPIDRTGNYQKAYVVQQHYGYPREETKDFEWEKYVNNHVKKKKVNVVETGVNLSEVININKLKVDQNDYKGKIYEHKLRYWRNGNRITGIYTWIKGYGFYFLGINVKDAKEMFWRNTNKFFVDGVFNVLKTSTEAFIPFIHNQHLEIVNPPLFYFIDGIRIKTELDYNAVRSNSESGMKYGYDALSICSCHPLCDITKKTTSEKPILWNDKPYTGKISPLASKFIYNISKGKLVSVKDRQEPTVIMLPQTTESIIAEEVAKNINNDRLEEDLESIFLNNYKKFPSDIKKLKTYNNERSKLAIEILETFMRDSAQLVALEINA